MRIVAQYLLFAAIVTTGCGQQAPTAAEFAAQRQRMVEQQLKPRGIKDERVLAAMAKVPREEFIPVDARAGLSLWMREPTRTRTGRCPSVTTKRFPSHMSLPL